MRACCSHIGLSISFFMLQLPTCLALAADHAGPPPIAEQQLAPHWRVQLDSEGQPVQWSRPDDQNKPLNLQLSIAVDRSGPAIGFAWEPAAQASAGDASVGVVGPTQRPTISAQDAAGVVGASLSTATGQSLSLAEWSSALAEGEFSLSVRAEDRLGNQSQQSFGPYQLDRTPPAFSWRRLDPIEGIPPDLYDGKRALIELSVTDEVAGIQTFQVDADTVGQAEAPNVRARTLEVQLTAAKREVQWQSSDRVGNQAKGTVSLRVDNQGPGLQIESAGQRIDPNDARLPPNQPLRLIAIDDAAGVEKACVKSSIWSEACRDLPLDLIGLSPGHYALTLFARDRLGNSTRRRIEIEVAP